MAHGDITHIDIPVDDLDRAREFYGTLFGWTFNTYPGFEDYPMWQAPNQISGGGLAQRTPGFTSPRSYVEVDSIDDVLAKVVDAGGTVAAGKQAISDTSWWAAVRDADGNEIGLYEGHTDTDSAG